MIKEKEILKEVQNLYINAGYGYRKIVQYLQETRDLKVSFMTIKRWIEDMGLEKHNPYPVKEFSKSWYKREYARLSKEYDNLKNEFERLQAEKEYIEEENKHLKEDLTLLKDQNRELRKIAVRAFREGLICKDVFKKVTKIF